MNPAAALARTKEIVPGSSRAAPLVSRYRAVRAETERLAVPLSAEDQTVQSMPDASPAKWHRAHTTWFFETFVLTCAPGYRVFRDSYAYLFNSYYDAVGPRHARALRGQLTRPTSDEIADYRAHVDDAMVELLSGGIPDPRIASLIELGLQHEQQHQELMLTDILHAFSQNPLCPAYAPYFAASRVASQPSRFVAHDGSIVEIGHAGDAFAFDNEGPRHEVIVEPFSLCDRLVTNAEWMEFMAAGGYENPSHWLSDGWQCARTEGWTAPLYWHLCGDSWHSMTLAGRRPIEPDAPVAHVSYYEADAFVRWRGKRLPTEQEWERAAIDGGARIAEGNFRDNKYLRPLPAQGSPGMQMFGDVWEWTQSPYTPYPGFRPEKGAVGEYNGKFMANQMVLRGGSCVTTADHIRATYRNFFYPHQRWQFSGVRLAEDLPRRRRRATHELPPFLDDVWSGLSAVPKRLPSKYFYDSEGSKLFEAICELPEYYLTRSETALLRVVARDLSESVAPGTALVEFGCGACTKTRVLLDRLPSIATYVPIDICEDSLKRSIEPLATLFPRLRILPRAGDFADVIVLPKEASEAPRLGFFSGSTIGNFESDDALSFLRNAREALGQDGRFLVAIDLVKDEATLLLAYDDAQGVTARFNRNLLTRINRELGGDFEPERFAHLAVWNAAKSRIEMHLLSREAQRVWIAAREFAFERGETIHTENSHKYTIESFAGLAAQAGWSLERCWKSKAPEFAMVLLR